MNKFKTILLINILVIFLILVATEIILFQKQFIELKNHDKIFGATEQRSLKYNPILKDMDTVYSSLRNDKRITYSISEDYKKGSIILFGCSFAYGTGLEDENTLSFKLSKETERSVYNFGVPSGGVQHMFDQLQRKNILSEIKLKPDYAFFLYVPPFHYQRLHLYTYLLFDDYRALEYQLEQNGDFKLKKRVFPKGLDGLYITKYIMHYLNYKNMKIKKNQYNKEIVLLMKASHEKLKEINPNIKFIVINMELDKLGTAEKEERKILFAEMNKHGIDVLDLEELTGIKYFENEYAISENDCLPKSEYWNIVVPLLARKLNL